MGLFAALLAALFAAGSNLFMRKSIDAGGTTRAYLLIQMSIAFLVAVLIGPVTSHSYAISSSIAVLGLLAGLVLAFMLIMLGKALEKGPPGLTFSILSGATVFPAVVMALFFGFLYTPWHAVGSILVLGGLYWAGRELQSLQNLKSWIFFSAAMFGLHVLLLLIFQWRAMLLSLPHPEELVSFFTAEQIQSQWFMPMLYLGAAVVQLAIYLRNEKRLPYPKEWANGVGGGISNSLCTFFLLKATEYATSLEQAVIFPLFSIGTIILSNLWSQRLYKENVNWRAAQICALGLLIGTVDWKSVMAAIGF